MILVDTNIPLRIAQVGHPHNPIALDALELLTRRDGEHFAVAPQSLYEMYVVLTRPASVNGFGYPPRQARSKVAAAQRACADGARFARREERLRRWNDVVQPRDEPDRSEAYRFPVLTVAETRLRPVSDTTFMPQAKVAMHHETLGELRQSDDSPFHAVATIRHGLRDITLDIIPDRQPLEIAIKLAAEVVERLSELDRFAKRIAARRLCDVYNGGWNAYDERQEDGSLKTVVNSRLSEAEFAAKLSLNTVSIAGDRMVDFSYDDEGMFWGHIVVVSSMHGVDFADAHVEICG